MNVIDYKEICIYVMRHFFYNIPCLRKFITVTVRISVSYVEFFMKGINHQEWEFD
jgi:hypothetical protein